MGEPDLCVVKKNCKKHRVLLELLHSDFDLAECHGDFPLQPFEFDISISMLNVGSTPNNWTVSFHIPFPHLNWKLKMYGEYFHFSISFDTNYTLCVKITMENFECVSHETGIASGTDGLHSSINICSHVYVCALRVTNTRSKIFIAKQQAL